MMSYHQKQECNVLYVDDEEINLRIFERAFRRKFAISVALSASEALQMMREKDFHIIVTDQRMPMMTGVEFLQIVSQKYPETVRIILTGYSEEKDIREAINSCGIYRYITKPWDEEDMSNVLASAIDTFRLKQDNKRLVYALQEHNDNLEQKVLERTLLLGEKNRQIREQNEILESAFEQVASALAKVEYTISELEEKNKKLEENNRRITDNIRYAKTIQTAVLPEMGEMRRFFSDVFVIFLPRDIVSGDFYWFMQTEEDTAFVAMVDCTGHGVAGAFMSLIGHILLDQILVGKEHIQNPAQILDRLHTQIVNILRQEDFENSDGMDIALCKIKKEKELFHIEFAGARRPLLCFYDKKLVHIKGTPKSIGGIHQRDSMPFVCEKITLQKGDKVYMFTDGYTDAANKKAQKIGTVSLKNIVENINLSTPNIGEQRDFLLDYVLKHQESFENQRDDISLLGIEL